MHNLVMPLLAAKFIALVAAWISPRLFVAGPSTGSAVFLGRMRRERLLFEAKLKGTEGNRDD